MSVTLYSEIKNIILLIKELKLTVFNLKRNYFLN